MSPELGTLSMGDISGGGGRGKRRRTASSKRAASSQRDPAGVPRPLGAPPVIAVTVLMRCQTELRRALHARGSSGGLLEIDGCKPPLCIENLWALAGGPPRTKYRGVTRLEKERKWVARVWDGERQLTVGRFDTDVAAAQARAQSSAFHWNYMRKHH